MYQHRLTACFRGIALFELLIAVSTIAVVVGGLLPANQKARESANRAQCQTIVSQIGIALAVYEADNGWYPRRIASGDDFGETLARKLGLRFGPNNTLIGTGYEFAYIGGEQFFELVAVPVAPGLTASTTQSIDDRSVFFESDGQIIVEVKEAPTPGADENRDVAFALIRECGKATVAELLLDAGTTDDANVVKCFVSGETPQVFKDLDSDGDGLVTFVEMFGGGKSRLPEDLLFCLEKQLHLGVGGENVKDLPGVVLKEVVGNPADLFSFQEVCDSTIIATQKAGVAKALCQKLDAAEKAELRGKFKVRNNILNSYQSQVSAQAGKAIPDDLVDLLLVLAEILKSEQK